MREGVIVNRVPVAFDKGADKEQEGALRLVEVRDQHLHDLVFIARGNDDLRAAMESSLVVTVEPGQDVLQGFQGFDGQLFLLIGLIISWAIYMISPRIYEATGEFTMDACCALLSPHSSPA